MTLRPDLAIIAEQAEAGTRGRDIGCGDGALMAALRDGRYDTPNIHHLTIDDFRGFLKDRGVVTEGAWFLNGARRIGSIAANLRAEHAIFLLRRG